MKAVKSFLTKSILSALLAVPATAAFAEEASALAVLGSSPFAHKNYGANVVKGRAELSPEGGEAAAQTKVVVRLTGLKPGTTHIGHIHGGTCAALAQGAILHNLEPVVANSSGEGSSKTEVPEGLQGFTDCSWWVAFHEGAANASPQTPAIAVGPVILRSGESEKKRSMTSLSPGTHLNHGVAPGAFWPGVASVSTASSAHAVWRPKHRLA